MDSTDFCCSVINNNRNLPRYDWGFYVRIRSQDDVRTWYSLLDIGIDESGSRVKPQEAGGGRP
eukprot:CAMPEP_0194349300 /NCGR_PEP_ID=MMETSP0171-20130528/107013_1 /TAXON_ID=218684 /ORGANISM="Corethron pennatum, Strain L29A3" /LENGTH=62 /DNA_ID=CAMNT_0039116733 /DNA_START=1437 /DNA_END=1621 /DNA_ORIENTATION=-